MDGFNETTETSGWSQKTVGLIVGAAIIAAVVIVAAVFFVRSRQRVGIDASNLSLVESQLEQTLGRCAMDPDPDGCRVSGVLSAARSAGAASLCSDLPAEEADNCVWLVARDSGNTDDCESIQDEEDRMRCADDIRVDAAISSGDAGLCAAIEVADRREQCVSLLAGPITSADCAKRVPDETFCSDLAVTEKAKSSHDPSLCLQILDEDRRMGCVDQTGSADLDGDGMDAGAEEAYGTSDRLADTDADGLNDAEEVRTYGTNPTVSDTDGDGFPDGTEVKGGYNPNGPGIL